MSDFKVGDIVMMKKQHACGVNEWEITKAGVDVRIKCQGCGRSILIPRIDFKKKLKKILISIETDQ